MTGPSKLYSIRYDEKPAFLYARVICDLQAADLARRYMHEIIEESRELKYSRTLIETDASASIYDILLSSDGDEKDGQETKSAAMLIVVFVDETQHDVDVARVRYAPMDGEPVPLIVKRFRDMGHARRWLHTTRALW